MSDMNMYQFLSLFIPVAIALFGWYRSSKDSSKKIAAIEKSTKQQIQKIANLSKFQALLAASKMDMELWETHFRMHDISGLIGDVLKDNIDTRQKLNDIDTKDFSDEELSRYQMLVFYDQQLRNLEGHIKTLWKEIDELKLA